MKYVFNFVIGFRAELYISIRCGVYNIIFIMNKVEEKNFDTLLIREVIAEIWFPKVKNVFKIVYLDSFFFIRKLQPVTHRLPHFRIGKICIIFGQKLLN